MSVHWGLDDWTGADKGALCFLCGAPLQVPYVYWSGFDAAIALHPACVKDLTMHLMRDTHEAERPDYMRNRIERRLMPGEVPRPPGRYE